MMITEQDWALIKRLGQMKYTICDGCGKNMRNGMHRCVDCQFGGVSE